MYEGQSLYSSTEFRQWIGIVWFMLEHCDIYPCKVDTGECIRHPRRPVEDLSTHRLVEQI